MTKENIKKLKKHYPGLLRIVNKIECDDGWFDLVSEALDKIENACGSKLSIIQIKEKFGRLVILTDVEASCTEAEQVTFWQLSNFYWNISASVCEETGSDGARLYKDPNSSLVKTLCPTAAAIFGFKEVEKHEKILYYPFTENSVDNEPNAA